MNTAEVRPEIELGPIRPPQRLAPYSYALGAEVKHAETEIVPEHSEGDAFGRLILLHDPDGSEAWDGTMRLVAYIQADLDSSEAVDPLLARGGLELARRRPGEPRRTRHRPRRHRHGHHLGALRRHLRSTARASARDARVLDGHHHGTRHPCPGVLRGARARRGPAAGGSDGSGFPLPRLTCQKPMMMTPQPRCPIPQPTTPPRRLPCCAPPRACHRCRSASTRSRGRQSSWRKAPARSPSTPSGRRASATPTAPT